jgi:L-arabinose transport system substrate-binding protein
MKPQQLRPAVKRFIACAGLIGLAAALTACGTIGEGSGDPGTDDGTIRIALIQKQGDQQYFIDEAEGATAAAEELGAEVTVIDVGDDANEAISQLDTVISQGYDGIIIVVPDSKIGPQVMEAAEKAGIPIVAANDAISDSEGNPAPFVGFDGTAMGEQVGAAAAELFMEAGWTAENTKIVRVSKEDLPTCEERVEGALAVFTEQTGVDLPVIKVGTDATVIDSQDKTAAAFTANPGVTNWVVWGCNDESETGAVTALQNAGVSPDNIIGVGLGAYLTCKDWAAGVESGNKAALYISGIDVGRASVEVMVDKIKNNVDLPANTIADTKIVDAETYEEAGVVCT